MNKEFNAILQKLEGKMQWTVFYVPFSVEEEYGTKSRFNVHAVIDGHPFLGTLLPSRNGHYMVYNKAMKSACKKEIGDSIHVILRPDKEERILNIPDYVLEAIRSNPIANSKFNELPYYIKREEINKIEEAKKEETRIRRLEKLIQKLTEKE
ncbi:YdeI/OmpD-associated family protein [Tepidimicrobium xylanilyticum]|uniref:Bacteriocin-protection, YdeI or OmpD-Associated n=2 Tax=Tepidimicrobium xylanilyticum TaxID=1123352 RepID=A0A1H2XI64_9FIRM|nr:hypothetical protein EN5CB1_23240 [Tepidimicrobium xylanilyticum]SDW92164.1 Bacteriocin-protection, YdeI or OmpD-Associated [Tepidimicrobium xylanilyticum]